MMLKIGYNINYTFLENHFYYAIAIISFKINVSFEIIKSIDSNGLRIYLLVPCYMRREEKEKNN